MKRISVLAAMLAILVTLFSQATHAVFASERDPGPLGIVYSEKS